MISAQIHKELMYIASNLPLVMDWSCEYHIVTMEEAKEHYPETPEKDFAVIKKGPNKDKVVVNFPVQIAVNHYRRMKKAFQKSGQPGVIDYIQKVKALEKEQVETAV